MGEIRLGRLVAHLVEQGVSGFVTTTNTGEFTTISSAERRQVLDIVMREAHGLPVLAHCTRLGTLQTLELVKHAADKGAKAAVVMPPYFGHFSDDEVEHHIQAIVQQAGLPIIIVDPQHVVRTHMREHLENIPNLAYAESLEQTFRTRLAVFPPGAASDEFQIEDAVVSPLVQVDPVACRGEADLKELSNFIARFGRARVAKAVLNARDFEVGPPRPPTLPLNYGITQDIVSLVQTA